MGRLVRDLWRETDWREAGGLLIGVLLIAALWWTPVVFPLKLLVVAFHEISHGLAALLTGGSVYRISLDIMQGGLCQTAGGSHFLVLSAGYVGSLLLGAGLLVLAARTRADRKIAIGLGITLIAVTFLYVDVLSFGWFFGAIMGGALVACGWRLPAWVSDAVLRLIGLSSCVYVPLDILSDTIVRDVPISDAGQLAQYTGIPGFFWGALWIGVSLGVILVSLVLSTRRGGTK